MFGLIPFFGEYLTSRLLQNMLSGLLNNMLVQPVPQTVQISGDFMSSDVRETPDSYVLLAYLPGATKESINVKYLDNNLTIAATSDQYVQNPYGGYVRYIGNMNRSFYFDDIDGDKVDGNFENGILKLTLPKKKQEETKE